jgi:hypothetical protein
MADDVDHAAKLQQLEEDILQKNIEFRRKQAASKMSDICDICGEDLIEFRKQFGRCVDCQSIIELKQSQGISRTFHVGEFEDE